MEKKKLEFRGGWMVAFLPVCIFLFFCILYFIVLKAFEMYALAMGAFVALLISAVFTKKGHYDRFWEAVYDGAKEAIPVAVLLLIIGMFSAMIKAANISTGFVWLADKLHVGGGLFTAFTFFRRMYHCIRNRLLPGNHVHLFPYLLRSRHPAGEQSGRAGGRHRIRRNLWR